MSCVSLQKKSPEEEPRLQRVFLAETISSAKKFAADAMSHLDRATKSMLCHEKQTRPFGVGNHKKPITKAPNTTKNAIMPLVSVSSMNRRMEDTLEQ